MDVALKELAEKLGICTHFSYVCNGVQEKEASAGLLRFLIESFGYKAKTEDDIRKSMERIEKKRWQYALDAIYVRPADNKNLDIVLTEKETQGETAFFYAPESKKGSSAEAEQWPAIGCCSDKRTRPSDDSRGGALVVVASGKRARLLAPPLFPGAHLPPITAEGFPVSSRLVWLEDPSHVP